MKTNNLYAQLSIGQGPAGPVGPQGPQGDKGDKGDTGAMGPQGPQGEKGERGAKGAQGKQGPQGKEGPQGPIGLRGEKGEKGDRGPQGIQGIQGPKGDKGDTGAQGPKGERGEKGEKGDAGGALPEDKIDYLGVSHNTLRETMDSNVDFVLGEVNRVHYEGQHITALDSIAGQAKNAILKGQTLVNLVGEKREYNSAGLYGWEFMLPYKLTKDARYMAVFNVSGTITDNSKVYLMDNGFGNGSGNTPYPVSFTLGYNKHITTASGNNHKVLRIRTGSQAVNDFKVSDVMLIPYQDGMENWDIPYFEGMTSVKAPVLTTIGKNLWDDNWSKGLTQTNGSVITGGTYDGFRYNNNLICVDGIDVIYLKHFCPQEGVSQSFRVGQYGKDKEWLNKPLTVVNDGIFNVPSDCEYIRVHIDLRYNGTSNNTSDSIPTMMVVSTSKITDYEPYKSNILTVNEEVELRGIGNVKDELDVVIGELTQRIGEIVLDGSEGVWSKHPGLSTDEYDVYWSSNGFIPSNGYKVACDKLSYSNPTTANTFRVNDSGGVFIGVSKGVNITNYLSQNTPKIQYSLTEKSIKTVDLSDNHVYSYKDTTHYSFETKENSLIPTLSLDVPTKLNALVARQKDTIQELTQENESLKAAQQILLNSQLSFYESLVSTIPALAPTEGQANIPDFIQDLYRLKNNQK